MSDIRELASKALELAAKATGGPWRACGDPANIKEESVRLGDMPPLKKRKELCSCGQIWSVPVDAPLVYVEGGNWGDRYPSLRVKEDGSLEAYQEMIVYGSIPREAQQANMAFIAFAREALPLLAQAVLDTKSAE